MTDSKTPPEVPVKPKRSWFRRLFRWVLILFLLVAIFHRPIFHQTVRFIAIRLAARQDLKLDLQLSGNVFTNLIVTKVQVTPTAHGPVDHIQIEHLRFDYSIPMLIRHGIGEFLRSYEIHNADLGFFAEKSKTESEREKKRTIADQLNQALGQPALYADRVNIENFNLTVYSPDKKPLTEIKRLDLFLDPERIGWFRIAHLQAPGLPPWDNLAADTSYERRNFFIKNLQLDSEMTIDELNFDASQRAQAKGSMLLKGHFFGGTAQVGLHGTELKKKGKNLKQSYDTILDLEAQDVSLEKAFTYFHAPKPPAAKLGKLALSFKGEPELPRTWNGNVTARIETIALGQEQIDSIGVSAYANNGHADIQGGNISAGSNSITFDAQVGLPESVNDFPKSDVDAKLDINAPDVPRLTAMMPKPISGALTGHVDVSLRERKLKAAFQVNGSKLGNSDFASSSIQASGNVSKSLEVKQGPFYEALVSSIKAEVRDLRLHSINADLARIAMESNGPAVNVQELELSRAANSVHANGTYTIPQDTSAALSSPADVQFEIAIPRLEEFGIQTAGQTLTGKIEGKGNLKTVNGEVNGDIRVEGNAFQLGDFKAERLAAKIQLAKNSATIDEFVLQIDQQNQINLVGESALQKPFAYDTALQASVKDLSALQPLLRLFGVQETLNGALQIDWHGKGELQPANHTGTVNLAIDKAHYGKIDITEFRLGGLYGPGFASSTELRAASGITKFEGALQYGEGKLRLKDIVLQQGSQQALTGYIILPIDLDDKEHPIPLEGRIAANVNARDLDIESLLASFGKPSPVKGKFTANLLTSGTLLNPVFHLKAEGRQLAATSAAQFTGIETDIVAHYAYKELTMNAGVRQAEIQPLTISGKLPLDLERVIKEKRYDPASPIELSVKMPPTSLAFVSKVTPAVRRMDGTGAIDLHLGGTLGKPEINGNVAIDITSARMASEQIPAIGNFHARINYTGETLTFADLHGEIGGGTFKLGGNIQFPELNQLSFGETVKVPAAIEPIFNLQLNSQEVLVKRDDAITVRTDADVKLTGPLKAAAVTGTIFVTHSRFFKEIDILPIAVPGRPKPVPSEVKQETTVSIPNPPLRAWTFDLAIKTRPNDPFLIRGNLANGTAAIDLKFAGTGLAPTLDGTVSIEQFTASLPFSTLTISRGFVYFKKEAPFVPNLDLQAESKLRDYQVYVYIYGTASDPQVQLNSEPPLQHADIVSLLATGTTTNELTANSDALATRAALLALQEIYRKTFKKGATPVTPQKNDSFLDRFSFDVGAINNRTGQQEVSGRFKLNDKLYLIGEVDVEGQVSGRLRYLIRFR